METPAFTTASEAASWLENLLRDTLKRRPDEIHLDSRSTAAPRDDSALHVTELANPCKRMAFFRMTDVPRDYDEERDAHWAHAGWLAENWIRAALRAVAPGEWRYQMPVPDLPPNVAGTLDLFWRRANVLVDAKSRSVNAGPPSEKDKQQVSIYGAHLDSNPFAVLIHVPREDLSKVAAYPVEYDPTFVRSKTAEDASALHRAIEHDEAPAIPRSFDAKAFPCSWRGRDGEIKACPFFSRCWQAVGVTLPAPSTPAMQDLIRRHAILAQQASDLDKQAKALREGDIKDITAQMNPYFDQHGVLVEGPEDVGKNLKRIAFAGRVTWDVESLLVKRPDLLETVTPYRKEGERYYQYRYVRKA